MITERGHTALTNRGLSTQAATIDLLVQGMTQKEIAYELGLCRRTVNQHLLRACQQLGVDNRRLLIAIVVQMQWVRCDICEHQSLITA